MKKSKEMAHGVRVSAQIDAVRNLAVGNDGLSERGVFWEADDANGVAVTQKAGTKLIKVRERPGADGQDTAAGVDEHQSSALDCRKIGVKSG